MDLFHQVNTIATIDLFCMSNITCIDLKLHILFITYYLADTYC